MIKAPAFTLSSIALNQAINGMRINRFQNHQDYNDAQMYLGQIYIPMNTDNALPFLEKAVEGSRRIKLIEP